jgi:methylated-DNA-[protein]-cysteine S-methyltransferase
MPTLNLISTDNLISTKTFYTDFALPEVLQQSGRLPFQGLRLGWQRHGLSPALTQIDFVWPDEAFQIKDNQVKDEQGHDLELADLPQIAACHQLLAAYFSGEAVSFETIPLTITKGSAFQQKAWQGLQTIPYGETRSYQWLAQWVGIPLASRAIGQANRANPIPIIIPCHRVLPAQGSLSNGKLGGYMGGSDRGIQIKSTLLSIEQGGLSI